MILLQKMTWICLILAAMLLTRCSERTVTVYTSQDQVYAEPILNDFTKTTGIKVRAVYDSEAVKTVGLVNRLLAEKDHPQCDVFWNNEEFRTRQLAASGVLRETNGWASFGVRNRRLVVNTNLLPLAAAPHKLDTLTNVQFFGKVAVAYPLFGTTSTHFLALDQAWGRERWVAWCKALQANKPFVVDGNSVVVQLVGKGEAMVGVTDSDDVLAGQHDGLPVASVLLTEDGFMIRNTVAVVAKAPHSDAAQKLFEYLQSESVCQQLAQAGAIEDVSFRGTGLEQKVDWDLLLKNQPAEVEILKGIFLR